MFGDRCTYVCIPCRFTSKHGGDCPLCGDSLHGWRNFPTPKKKDDKGWKKIQLMWAVNNTEIELCTWTCCVPIHDDVNRLTLSQYRARVRKQLTHLKDRGFRQYEYSKYRHRVYR